MVTRSLLKVMHSLYNYFGLKKKKKNSMLRFRVVKNNFLLIIFLIAIVGSFYFNFNYTNNRIVELAIEIPTENVKQQQHHQAIVESIIGETNAFLVNINILNETTSNPQLSLNLTKLLKEHNHLVFGVFENELVKLDKFKSQSDCLVSKSKQFNKTTAVYCVCKQITLQISIFYRRGDFYWIGVGRESNTTQWFGDVPRAINNFTLRAINQQIKIPFELTQFLYDYKHSRFIECDRSLANEILSDMGKNYKSNDEKNEAFMHGFRYIRSVLEGNYKNYWLAAGTLLGWYRECGIIKHTTDADIGMYSDEYEEKIKEIFLKSDEVSLRITLGFLNECYELRMRSKHMKMFDLFLFYKHNATHHFNGYQINRKIKRQMMPYFNESNLCSGELLNSKFMVPCNPINYLLAQYGYKWMFPLAKKYINRKSMNFYRSWTDEEWPYAVRKYYRGQLDVDATLKTINKHLEIPLKELPQYNGKYKN